MTKKESKNLAKGLSHFTELVPETPSFPVSDEKYIVVVAGTMTEPPWKSQNKVSELKYSSDIGVGRKLRCPQSLTADQWGSYQREMIKVRKKGGYTDKQAHYWRLRTVFRYLNACANKEQLTKREFIHKRLQEIYPDVIQFGCEQVRYDSCDVEGWINNSCPFPGDPEEKTKPWVDSTSDMPEEPQMKRKSRLRECVQAIALIMFSRNIGLTNEAFIQMCRQDDIQAILDIARVDDSSDREAVWEPSERLVRRWVKELIDSIRPVSKKGNRALR